MPVDPLEKLNDWLPQGVNIFKCLSDLVEHVELTLKEDFCIVDSEDVMKNPADMLKKYCDSVGFTYSEGLLKLEPGLPEGDTWVIHRRSSALCRSRI